MILQGKILEAMDRFYADDVVMQENLDAPFTGKAFNRQREADWLASVEQFHSAECIGSAVNGDLSYSEWSMDITFKGGKRVKSSQVAARRWKNGQIVHERFYYNKG
jgi:ketosteroid isomerase-like protein